MVRGFCQASHTGHVMLIVQSFLNRAERAAEMLYRSGILTEFRCEKLDRAGLSTVGVLRFPDSPLLASSQCTAQLPFVQD